jgi:P pilus assembly chaperone PapD
MKPTSLVLALVVVTAPLGAQGVVIAPHAVFLDARTRSGAVLLYNPNAQPVEVAVSFFYGYPVTDSLGRVVVQTVDHPDSTGRSAASWIQAFPRRLTVPPLERQTIRLLVTPPATLSDGEYWARLAISAKGGPLPVTGVADTARVRVGLTLEVRTIIGVFYRNGTVRTGVALSELRAARVGDSLAVWCRLTQQGNAAYIGTVHAVLSDSAGRVVSELKAPIGVYYTMVPRYALPLGALAPGHYRLRLELSTDREDLAPEVLLPSPSVRDSVEVRIP